MGKVVIRILQGSAVTQTMLGGLTIYPPVANFLQCMCAKNYENWLAVDKVITKIIRLTCFWPTLYMLLVSKSWLCIITNLAVLTNSLSVSSTGLHCYVLIS